MLLISEGVLYARVVDTGGWHSWGASSACPHFTSSSDTLVLHSGPSLSSWCRVPSLCLRSRLWPCSSSPTDSFPLSEPLCPVFLSFRPCYFGSPFFDRCCGEPWELMVYMCGPLPICQWLFMLNEIHWRYSSVTQSAPLLENKMLG